MNKSGIKNKVQRKTVWSRTILDIHGYAHYLNVTTEEDLKYLQYHSKKNKNKIEADDIKRLYNFYTCKTLWSICSSFIKDHDRFYLLKNKCVSVEPEPASGKQGWTLNLNYPINKDDYYMHIVICLNKSSIRVFDINTHVWAKKELNVWPGDAIVMPNGGRISGDIGQAEYEKPVRFYRASYSVKQNKYTTAIWKEPVHTGINNHRL